MAFFSTRAQAESNALHAQVMVFLPAYEGSLLFDPNLANKGDDATCVWGSVDAIRRSDLYLALRMPNPLEAKPMLRAGPIDVYGHFVTTLTEAQDRFKDFKPYTLNADFFIFSYDWRQELATVTVPRFKEALQNYARIHQQKTGIPAERTEFILVAHSMGGLVARTFLSMNPEWAQRIAEMYTVGTPNLGSVKAIKTLVVGPGGIKENAIDFPASLLRFLPNNVDVQLSKLVAITRPSIYELLPLEDPFWEVDAPSGQRSRIGAEQMLTVGTWAPYWPSAKLEKEQYLDSWLKKQVERGRRDIHAEDYTFCQDTSYKALQRILSQVREWRLRIGSLKYTQQLLTLPGDKSRLFVIIGTGFDTPSGIITSGEHDLCNARFTLEVDGDETVTKASALDDLSDFSQVHFLNKVPHGRMMNDRQFLDFLLMQLSPLPMVPVVDSNPSAD